MRTSKFSLAVMMAAVFCLDLAGGWMGQNVLPFRRVPSSMEGRLQPNSRGESISGAYGIKVYDSGSGELLWTAPSGESFPYLVADHYLVGLRPGKLEVIDLDSALASPVDKQKLRHHEFQKFGSAIDGFVPGAGVLHKPILAIPDSDRFLVHTFTDSSMSTSTVTAFEIKQHSLVQLSQWQSGPANSAVTVLPSGLILSPTPNNLAVEVREPSQFELLRTMPLPAGMISWTQAQTHNDLFTVLDPATRTTRAYRLDDFSFVLDSDVPLRTIDQETGTDRRYHLFAGANLSTSRRLLVFDSVDRRVAYDSRANFDVQNAVIRSGQLVIESDFGLTRTLVDLKSSQARVERPYFWIIVGTPIVLLLAIVWFVIWAANFSYSARWLPLNICFVSLLFIAPLQWHMGQAATIFPGRIFENAPLHFVFVVILALFFCLAMFAAFAKSRLATRYLPLCLAVTLLYSAAYILKSIDFETASPYTPAVKSLRIWMTFTLFSAICLGGARALGQSVELDVPSRRRRRGPAYMLFSGIRLADIFLLTTLLAACMTLFGAQIDLLLSPAAGFEVLGKSCLLVASACLGLVALVPGPRIYTFATRIAAGLALFLIFDIVLQTGFPRYYRVPGLGAMLLARYPVFLGLCVFAFCLMMRQAGYRWHGDRVS